ncbi:MAG: GNAT family N-acetyltransferase [Campylobacteraceae bacterium 4484_4]|nr:MAG: GNAT family N-acetyltransferase [Campylobacteraceae bacterium 4484_4]
MITYTKATLKDIDAMQKLVQPEVESGKILYRAPDEIATNIRSYTLAKEGDELLGFGALHIHAPALAEIRSLIVSEKSRGKGIGRQLVRDLLKEAKEIGVKQVFTLTYEKLFFEKLGLREIPKESLPEHKIWADCIKCKHFPVCDEIALIIDI